MLRSLYVFLSVMLVIVESQRVRDKAKHHGKTEESNSTDYVSIFKTRKIFGGYDAAEGFAPHQVSLRSAKDTSFHFCGGSIISKCHVLTAGHCAPSCQNKGCKVAYGDNNLKNQKMVEIDSITRHEQYTLTTSPNGNIIYIRNDIAIIKLPQENYFSFDDNVKEIPLNMKPLSNGEKQSITGWGYINSDNEVPQNLQATEVQVVTCPASQRTWYNFICLQSMDSGSCPGDSGGPMVYENTLSGVTSFGSPCGSPPGRDGYTNVSAYIGWINGKMQANPC